MRNHRQHLVIQILRFAFLVHSQPALLSIKWHNGTKCGYEQNKTPAGPHVQLSLIYFMFKNKTRNTLIKACQSTAPIKAAKETSLLGRVLLQGVRPPIIIKPRHR